MVKAKASESDEWVLFPALMHIYYMNLAKPLHLSVSQFSHSQRQCQEA